MSIDEDVDLECLPADEAGPYNFSGEDTCGPIGIQGRQSPALILQTMSRESMYEKLNVNCSESPLFPAYSTHSDRWKTFSNWPSKSRLSPEALSEAGFFYVGEHLSMISNWYFGIGNFLYRTSKTRAKNSCNTFEYIKALLKKKSTIFRVPLYLRDASLLKTKFFEN